MFVHLLWFCSTPDEPHGKKRVAIFRSNFRGLPIGAEQKLKPEIGQLFFKPITFKKIPVLLMRPKGYSIMAVEQLSASPLRTGTPFGGHQHR